MLESIGFYFWVFIVGVCGGILNLAHSGKSGKSSLHRALNALIGTLSSMFVCWLAYEAALYFTQAPKFSLAIGGFFAWRGAEWATAMIDKAIDKKIDSINGSRYDSYDDFGYKNTTSKYDTGEPRERGFLLRQGSQRDYATRSDVVSGGLGSTDTDAGATPRAGL